jgi:hypothetical protein
MRRDVTAAVAALERHELDLAFGNVANLEPPLPGEMSAELVTTDPIAVLVNARGALAAREHVTPEDLARHGIWWPTAGSSPELLAFAGEYARAIGATLHTGGSNLGLDALVERVAGDPDVVVPVGAAWPLAGAEGVRVVPVRPTPLYPWYAVWRTAGQHPTLPRLLRAIRATGREPESHGETWLPRAVSA